VVSRFAPARNKIKLDHQGAFTTKLEKFRISLSLRFCRLSRMEDSLRGCMALMVFTSKLFPEQRHAQLNQISMRRLGFTLFRRLGSRCRLSWLFFPFAMRDKRREHGSRFGSDTPCCRPGGNKRNANQRRQNTQRRMSGNMKVRNV